MYVDVTSSKVYLFSQIESSVLHWAYLYKYIFLEIPVKHGT